MKKLHYTALCASEVRVLYIIVCVWKREWRFSIYPNTAYINLLEI